MTKYLQILCAMALVCVMGAPSKLAASTITFTDRDAFNAAVGSTVRVGLDEPGNLRCDFAEDCPVTVVFDDGLFRFSGDFLDFPAGDFRTGVLSAITIGSFSGSIGGTLVPSWAVGFDIMPNVGSVTLAIFGSGSFSKLFNLDSPQFMGFLFDEPITSLGWSLSPPIQCATGTPGGFCERKIAIVDNIVLKTVPEPATVLLFGAATMLLSASRRRVHGWYGK